jgi:hypothetical protein
MIARSGSFKVDVLIDFIKVTEVVVKGVNGLNTINQA